MNRSICGLCLLGSLSLFAAPASALTKGEAVALLKLIDTRLTHNLDYTANFFLQETNQDKSEVVYNGMIYRRDASDQLMLLFLEPKTERGRGYLRMSRNLWYYEPRTGKWDRRTERERIAGTGSRRADFDKSEFSKKFDVVSTAEGRLGKHDVYEIRLKAKPDANVDYPIQNLWISREQKNLLKKTESADSGKLMRTVYYPKWAEGSHGGKTMWYPKEVRAFDELVKGSKTVIMIKGTSDQPLPASQFTKAWFESKSR